MIELKELIIEQLCNLKRNAEIAKYGVIIKGGTTTSEPYEMYKAYEDKITSWLHEISGAAAFDELPFEAKHG